MSINRPFDEPLFQVIDSFPQISITREMTITFIKSLHIAYYGVAAYFIFSSSWHSFFLSQTLWVSLGIFLATTIFITYIIGQPKVSISYRIPPPPSSEEKGDLEVKSSPREKVHSLSENRTIFAERSGSFQDRKLALNRYIDALVDTVTKREGKI